MNVIRLTRRAAGKLLNQIEWKCQREGRAFARVDPRGTTIQCSDCGALVPKTLSIRVHVCTECGVVRDRDQNAAANILARAGWGPRAVKSEIGNASSGASSADSDLKHGGDNAAGPRREERPLPSSGGAHFAPSQLEPHRQAARDHKIRHSHFFPSLSLLL